MTIVLYVIAVLIGTSLGLIGAGGAIVAVPAFVYLGGIPPTLASGYALFVIAIATLVGAVQYLRKQLVDWRSVFAFGVTTLTSIAVVRKFVMPLLPPDIDMILMLAFAGVLLTAGTAMLRSTPKPHTGEPPHIARLTGLGLAIGIISGFLGVGGGFLMTPALVLWANLDMKKAVGTSLVLISANGLAGSLADLSTNVTYDWPFLLTFTALTTLGVFFGTLLSHRIDGERLKKGFGWFVVVLGVAVMLRELLY
ncbi:MAG: sulfite exporter TauE/SafE family protein [Ignavibacteriae bacterium]|nr:MAG: sulfite exporter TauE/SafE family protein [Ignavibacteriota bacterium]